MYFVKVKLGGRARWMCTQFEKEAEVAAETIVDFNQAIEMNSDINLRNHSVDSWEIKTDHSWNVALGNQPKTPEFRRVIAL
jgi:hypothetical protein